MKVNIKKMENEEGKLVIFASFLAQIDRKCSLKILRIFKIVKISI
jgi:hypothetical protein